MPSPRLQNYLLTHRKRSNLKQTDVAFLVGCKSGSKISAYERFVREPNLMTALACEVIFEVPVRELFAGLYDEVREQVKERQHQLAQGWFANVPDDWPPPQTEPPPQRSAESKSKHHK